MASPLELRARRLEKAHEDFLTASREYDLFHVAVRSDEVESMACLDGLSDARLSDAFVELFEPLPTEHRRGQAVDAFGSLAYHYGQRPWIKSHAAAFWQSSLNRHPKDSTARIVREQQKDIPIPGSGTKKPSLETLQTFVWRELVFRIGGVKELQGQPSVHSGKGGRCRMIYYGRDYRDYVFSPHCVSQFFRLVRQAADDFDSDDAAVADAWVLRMYDTFKPKSIVVGPFDVFHLSSNVFEASARVIEVLIDKPDWRFALAETRSNRNSFHVGRTPRETRQDER